MTSTEIVTALVGLIAGGHGVWFWYDKKEKDKNLSDLSTKMQDAEKLLVKHANQFVTDPTTRKIVKEELETMRRDVSETRDDVTKIKELTQELVTEIRVVNAVQKALKENKPDK